MTGKEKGTCPFCRPDRTMVTGETRTMLAVKDNSPVSEYHMLIIPKRHCASYFDLTPAELKDADFLLRKLQKEILEKDSTVRGFNIGINNGACAGQTIFHAHIHLIPRRKNDTPNPRGGVRGVIPDKMDY